MSRFAPLLLLALAATPFVHSIAVPNQFHSASDKVLEAREPIAFPAPIQIGDLVSFQNGQLLRRDNETAPFEVFALESRSNLHERDVVVKRAQVKWTPPFKEIPPEDIAEMVEDETVVKCGDLGYVLFGNSIGSGSFGNIFEAITQDDIYVAMKGVPNQQKRDDEWNIFEKVGDNPNIIKAHARCKFGGQYYIALDLIEGGTLQQRIDSKVYSSI